MRTMSFCSRPMDPETSIMCMITADDSGRGFGFSAR